MGFPFPEPSYFPFLLILMDGSHSSFERLLNPSASLAVVPSSMLSCQQPCSVPSFDLRTRPQAAAGAAQHIFLLFLPKAMPLGCHCSTVWGQAPGVCSTTRCWHCSQKVPPLACVFQCGGLDLELSCRGPQRLRIFLSCLAGTSTALAAVVQLLCCDPLPGLQAADSSRTKQSMVIWSARMATSVSLQSFTLWRHRASLQAQEGTYQQVLARAGIPPPLIPNCMHTVPFSSWTHTCVCSCNGGVSGSPRCAAGTLSRGVQSGAHTYPGACCTCSPCSGLRRPGR